MSTFPKRCLFTVGVAFLSWRLAEALPWYAWRTLIRDTVIVLSNALGYPLNANGFEVTLGGATSFIGPDCTYASWIAFAAPLLWTSSAFHINALRVLLAFALSQIINVLRISAAMIGTANGISWFWAHDVPDYTLWYGSILLVAWNWLRAFSPTSPHP